MEMFILIIGYYFKFMPHLALIIAIYNAFNSDGFLKSLLVIICYIAVIVIGGLIRNLLLGIFFKESDYNGMNYWITEAILFGLMTITAMEAL